MLLCPGLLCGPFHALQFKNSVPVLGSHPALNPSCVCVLMFIYTKSRSWFDRFYWYCFPSFLLFISLPSFLFSPQLPTYVLRLEEATLRLVKCVCRVMKRSLAKYDKVVTFGPPTLSRCVRTHRKKIVHSGRESRMLYWGEAGIVLVSMADLLFSFPLFKALSSVWNKTSNFHVEKTGCLEVMEMKETESPQCAECK